MNRWPFFQRMLVSSPDYYWNPLRMTTNICTELLISRDPERLGRIFCGNLESCWSSLRRCSMLWALKNAWAQKDLSWVLVWSQHPVKYFCVSENFWGLYKVVESMVRQCRRVKRHKRGTSVHAIWVKSVFSLLAFFGILFSPPLYFILQVFDWHPNLDPLGRTSDLTQLSSILSLADQQSLSHHLHNNRRQKWRNNQIHWRLNGSKNTDEKKIFSLKPMDIAFCVMHWSA